MKLTVWLCFTNGNLHIDDLSSEQVKESLVTQVWSHSNKNFFTMKKMIVIELFGYQFIIDFYTYNHSFVFILHTTTGVLLWHLLFLEVMP